VNVDANVAAVPAARAEDFSGLYKWVVLALTTGLMISDYATRSAISSVFPLLKAEWSLSDVQLGALVSIIALTIGIGSFPIALLADRWGRVKSVTAMAGVWCAATIGCGISQNYGQLLAARAGVGLGEAGYGGAGGAILAHVFPPERRGMVYGTLVCGSLIGLILGVSAGGYLGATHGWRAAFLVIGGLSLVIVVLYGLLVKDYDTVALVAKDGGQAPHAMRAMDVARELFTVPTAVYMWIAGGFASLSLGAFLAWIPAYVGRYYGLGAKDAGVWASAGLLLVGIGMILGGIVADRLAKGDGKRKLRMLALYMVVHFALLTSAFALPPGDLQAAWLGVGALFCGTHAGLLIAVTADVVHPGLRATGIAVMVLANNLLGFAPAPLIVGALSDRYGLKVALSTTPVICIVAGVLFWMASNHYNRDRRKAESTLA
jgi:predicted MFS family arabinose efflux permease